MGAFRDFQAEELMQGLRDGTLGLTPTDKSYKVYVDAVENGEETAGMIGKFYLERLSLDERSELVDLYNEKKIRMGFPGYFYVPPFFCERT